MVAYLLRSIEIALILFMQVFYIFFWEYEMYRRFCFRYSVSSFNFNKAYSQVQLNTSGKYQFYFKWHQRDSSCEISSVAAPAQIADESEVLKTLEHPTSTDCYDAADGYLSEGFQVIIEKSKEAKCSLKDVQLRFLCPDDLEEVRSLCRDWFPIEYPQSWYEDITSSERFFALAAVYKSQIIGLIVAEIKPYLKLNAEDRGILSRWFASKDTLVAYILSLGVVRSYRRSGVATMLLDVLINHLSGSMPQPPHEHRVKAIFLHVLTTNSEAILFYEKRRFRLHSFLPYYYSIKGRCKDGFTYVYYVNGGHAPWGLYDYMKYVARAAWRGGGLYPWLWGKLRTALTIAWHR